MTTKTTSRALALLLQGRAITHRDFWLHAGTYRLSADIHLLRTMGWDIQDTPEVVPTSDPTKRRAHIKRYHLPNEAISAADEAAGTLGQATDHQQVSTGAQV